MNTTNENAAVVRASRWTAQERSTSSKVLSSAVGQSCDFSEVSDTGNEYHLRNGTPLLTNSRPSESSPGKNSIMQSQSLHVASTVQSRVAGSYEGRLISTIQSSSLKLMIRRASRCASIRHSGRRCGTTGYATVVLPLPRISNDLEVVRLL